MNYNLPCVILIHFLGLSLYFRAFVLKMWICGQRSINRELEGLNVTEEWFRQTSCDYCFELLSVSCRYLLVIRQLFNWKMPEMLLWKRECETMIFIQFRLQIFLTGGNWRKWKRVFLTCPCHEIYRDEAVGLKSCKNAWKITIFVKMWNLEQYRENLIFCQ